MHRNELQYVHGGFLYQSTKISNKLCKVIIPMSLIFYQTTIWLTVKVMFWDHVARVLCWYLVFNSILWITFFHVARDVYCSGCVHELAVVGFHLQLYRNVLLLVSFYFLRVCLHYESLALYRNKVRMFGDWDLWHVLCFQGAGSDECSRFLITMNQMISVCAWSHNWTRCLNTIWVSNEMWTSYL